jgi:hypothetical protein
MEIHCAFGHGSYVRLLLGHVRTYQGKFLKEKPNKGRLVSEWKRLPHMVNGLRILLISLVNGSDSGVCDLLPALLAE